MVYKVLATILASSPAGLATVATFDLKLDQSVGRVGGRVAACY
jgi:hypothetical protein